MPNTCMDCNGTGWIGGDVCETCMGNAAVPVKDPVRKVLKDHSDRLDDMDVKLDDILDKCNDILEQVSA